MFLVALARLAFVCSWPNADGEVRLSIRPLSGGKAVVGIQSLTGTVGAIVAPPRKSRVAAVSRAKPDYLARFGTLNFHLPTPFSLQNSLARQDTNYGDADG